MRKRIGKVIALISLMFPSYLLIKPLCISSAEASKGIESTFRTSAEIEAEEYEEELRNEIYKREKAAVDLEYYYVPWADIRISRAEFDLLCRTTYCEAGNQSLDAQRMVATVIINRIISEDFPNSMHDVIYQVYNGKPQFTVICRADFDTVDYRQGADLTEVACFLAIATYPEDPPDMLYFRSEYYHSHSFADDYKPDGDMYFSLAKKN